MYANRRNFRVLNEIGAEEHDSDVIVDRKWKYGRFAYAQCIRNSSFIMDGLDVAIGQIPRFQLPQNAFLVTLQNRIESLSPCCVQNETVWQLRTVPQATIFSWRLDVNNAPEKNKEDHIAVKYRHRYIAQHSRTASSPASQITICLWPNGGPTIILSLGQRWLPMMSQR